MSGANVKPFDAAEESKEIFLASQKRWLEDPAKVAVWQKSRRIGASWTSACRSVVWAALPPKGVSPRDQWYVAYNRDMTQEFVRDSAFFATLLSAAVGNDPEGEAGFLDEDGILTYRITFKNGKRITALSSAPKNLRSKQGDVTLDELAFHPDPAALLKAALALIIWGGRIRILSTHLGEDNPFNELCKDILDGKKPYSLHTTTFKDAIEEGLFRKICLRTGQVWSPDAEAAFEEEIRANYRPYDAEELDCIPSKGGENWLSRDLVERAMQPSEPACQIVWLTRPHSWETVPEPVRREEIDQWIGAVLAPAFRVLNPDLPTYAGMDFGRDGDLSDLTLGQRNGGRMEMRLTVEMRRITHAQQRQIVWWVLDRIRFLHAAFDASGNGDALAEESADRYGSRITQQKMSSQWYELNGPPYKAGLEDALIVLANDPDSLADHRLALQDKGVPYMPARRTKGQDNEKRHGDDLISKMLCYQASRIFIPNIDEIRTFGLRNVRQFAGFSRR